ncbi:MAG: MogA/MoaB family molybdenum cofactor biosynthesis protein [Vicinamibacteraceae bacterium]
MSHEQHRAAAPRSVGCAVLSISDSRTLETDTGGRLVVELLEANGHRIVDRGLVKDDPEEVINWIQWRRAMPEVQAIITTGGTGIGRRDNTHEAISRLFDKALPGFGELFRMLSYQDIGPAAMLSRACAGISQTRLLMALPGSPAAVRLAMDKLILPELGHLVREATR